MRINNISIILQLNFSINFLFFRSVAAYVNPNNKQNNPRIMKIGCGFGKEKVNIPMMMIIHPITILRIFTPRKKLI